MKMSDWLYRQVRKRAAFSHGGILHQDCEANDFIATFPNIPITGTGIPDVKYERRTQKFWLIILNKFFLTK